MTRELALLAPSCCFMVRALLLPYREACRYWQAFGGFELSYSCCVVWGREALLDS